METNPKKDANSIEVKDATRVATRKSSISVAMRSFGESAKKLKEAGLLTDADCMDVENLKARIAEAYSKQLMG